MHFIIKISAELFNKRLGVRSHMKIIGKNNGGEIKFQGHRKKDEKP